MTKTEKLEQRFRRLKKTKAFCDESKAWLGQMSLRAAWRRCEVGSWMAYWLWRETDVRYEALEAVAGSCGGVSRILGGAPNERHQTAYAEALRAHFTVFGNRRRER